MENSYANQSRAMVQGDQAGRDIIKNEFNLVHQGASQVTAWLRRLEAQLQNENRDLNNSFVDSLSFFVDQRDSVEVDVVGLKAKLEKCTFDIPYHSALLKKEEFAKLLLKYQEFSSAQELFAYFLSIIYDVFDEKICPVVKTISYAELQDIIDKQIIDKIFHEIGAGSDVLFINRNHVRGMIYWLADKCYVRWH